MEKNQLLIIEDEPSVAKQLKWGLSEKYDITIAGNAKEAKKYLNSGRFPVATLDLGLPPNPDTPVEGLALLEALPSYAPDAKIIIISGNDEKETAMKGVKLGAVDFCPKPIDLELLSVILSRTYRIFELEESNRRLQQGNYSGRFCGMLGVSSVMTEMFDQVRKVSVTDYPVLITGESGTGKEMVAQSVHQLSRRSKKSMVIINCGAIPENLLESELFGHEKGAFTGATSRQTGKLEQAQDNSLFLDEIGELPLNLQVKLLRFIQEGTIERLGGSKPILLDVRIVAATNVDLEAAVKQGAFREDLFFRLNVVPLNLPPLRERGEDIVLLAHEFLKEEARKLSRGSVKLAPSAISALTAHAWPGNVRELQNRIRRGLGLSSGTLLTVMDLGFKEENGEDGKLPTLKEAREQAEKAVIRKALALTDNNISQAAQLLEISRPTLHDQIKKHGLAVNEDPSKTVADRPPHAFPT